VFIYFFFFFAFLVDTKYEDDSKDKVNMVVEALRKLVVVSITTYWALSRQVIVRFGECCVCL